MPTFVSDAAEEEQAPDQDKRDLAPMEDVATSMDNTAQVAIAQPATPAGDGTSVSTARGGDRRLLPNSVHVGARMEEEPTHETRSEHSLIVSTLVVLVADGPR